MGVELSAPTFSFRRGFSFDREVALSRLEELQNLADRQHAEVFRDHAFRPVKDQVAVLRRLLDDSQVGASGDEGADPTARPAP